jgi:hypothetical protein
MNLKRRKKKMKDSICEIVLKDVTLDTCRDFRESRRWVMCKAWELMDKQKVGSFKEAISKAWSELREKCRAPSTVQPTEFIGSRKVTITGELQFL